MTELKNTVRAEVISVQPNRVRISVDDLTSFRVAEEVLRVGSYLKVSDNIDVALICIIESFSIEVKDTPDGNSKRSYIIDAYPLGTLSNGKFKRGGDELAIPPKQVVPATAAEIASIYKTAFEDEKQFIFSSLTRQRSISVPVHGDRFFNKHIAIVGATGSGKSNTVATILQKAKSQKSGNYDGLNNSHIVVFDIHGEYKSAFPDASTIDVNDLVLPYWLLNDEEIETMFLESGDNNNYNQESLLRNIIVTCKSLGNPTHQKVQFDSPLKFDLEHLQNCFSNLVREAKNADNPLIIALPDRKEMEFSNEAEKMEYFCKNKIDFGARVTGKINRGTYADGTIDKFVWRIASKINNPRLNFMFGDKAKDISFNDVLRQILGYEIQGQEGSKAANITIIDLSGIPFDVLSITVSLITRLLFDYAYYSRRINSGCDTPLLLVYEEAHKYAPKSGLARYKPSLSAIERIAKEGRKYGVSLLIASQRPSEISETIFSQCSNFLAMRLTNPDDQAYVRRLLPDTLGDLTAGIPALESGEALLIGDATVMPSIVYITKCNPEPSSNDIPYYDIWKQQWKDVQFNKVETEWKK